MMLVIDMFRIIKSLELYVTTGLLIAMNYGVLASDLTVINRRIQNQVNFEESIKLQSADVACLGTDPVLTVTGTNVTWYADKDKNIKLAEGNTYHSQPLHSTTNFYLTQTINGIQSEVTIITIEVVTAILDDYLSVRSSCGRHDGSFRFVGHGGSVRYPVQFRLDDGPFQTSRLFENLASGTYTLTVQAAACYGSLQVEIKAQPSPVISLVDVQDPGCGKEDGTLRIAAYGGNGTLTYSIDGTVFDKRNIFEGLEGGEYVVWVKDDSLCKISETVILKSANQLLLSDIEVSPTTCGQNNGSITLPDESSNGILYYSLNQGTEQTINSFDSLSSGNYMVSMRNEDGCTVSSEVIIEHSDGPKITEVDIRHPKCERSDGSVTIYGSGSGVLHYSIDGESFKNHPAFSELKFGNYSVAVKDENGYIVLQEINLVSPCESNIFLPSAFSPNADGINDLWSVFFPHQAIDIEEVTIINRWGEMVFYSHPGQVLSGYQIWDGRYKGVYTHGIFTYRLKWRQPLGPTEVVTGKVLVF